MSQLAFLSPAFLRTCQISSNLGNVTEKSYDARGNLLTQKTTTAEGLVTQSSSTYDIYGNVLTETDPNGHVTTFT